MVDGKDENVIDSQDVISTEDDISKQVLDNLDIETTPAEDTKPEGDDDKKPAEDKKPEGDDDKKPEDPEFELDFGSKEQPSKRKIKLSELHSMAMQGQDYTKKQQALSEQEEKHKDLFTFANAVKQHPKLSNLIVGLMGKVIGKDDQGKGFYNDEYIEKALNFIDGKIDAAKEATEEKLDDIEELLKEHDEDSPTYKALITLHKRNSSLLQSLDNVQKKLDQVDKGVKDRATKEEDAKQEEAVAKAKDFYRGTLASLSDPEKGEYKFESDAEKNLWIQGVNKLMLANPQKYTSEKAFAKAIQEFAKQAYDTLAEIFEGKKQAWIKSKVHKMPVDGADGGKQVDSDTQLDLSDPSNMQETLENLLGQEESARTANSK